MKLATQTFVSAAALAASTMSGLSAMAHADPDRHMPNMQAGYYPGGGMGAQISLAYCDGVPYPDGPSWHAIQYGAPMIGHPYGIVPPGLQCVVGGGAVPSNVHIVVVISYSSPQRFILMVRRPTDTH